MVAGTANAMFQPGASSTVHLVARDVQGANGVLRISEALTALGGPALAGVLVGVGATGWVMVISAVAYGTSAFCLFALRLGAVPAPPAGDSLWHNLVVGWHEFRSRNWLWGVIVIWMFFAVLSWGPQLSVAAGVMRARARCHRLRPAQLRVRRGHRGRRGAGDPVQAGTAARRRGRWRCSAYPLYPLGIVLDWAGLAAAPPPRSWSAVGITFWGVMWATTVQTQVPGRGAQPRPRLRGRRVRRHVPGRQRAGRSGRRGVRHRPGAGGGRPWSPSSPPAALLTVHPIRTLGRIPDRA
ncbi:hypothetical protein GCM10017687_05770 [Streptomyces echinatus]|uniref:hypothetical protein n=1 Tax=Streptomyces echinatus TaxID=67293 RepID=UPI0031EE84D8